MKNNILILTAILICASVGMGKLDKTKTNEVGKSSSDAINPTIITNLDNVLMNPDQFTGYITVEGKVAMVDSAKSMFGLGCDDGCLILPVKCSGEIPQKDSEVTVFGELKKIEGEGYIFESQKVEVK